MRHLGLLTVLLGLTMGLWDDHVALLNNGQPVEVFPYRASIYPETDQVLLDRGIPIPDESTYTRLLEDYFS